MNWNIEEDFYKKGYLCVAGTDEAGRGPLMGPVFAAACILPLGIDIPKLNDSKKLSEKRREELFDIIVKNAVSYGIAYASVEEIDEMNILAASQLAMRRAVAMLEPLPDMVLVDGNVAREFPMDTLCVVKGDALSPSIAAASILAKVSRDRVCVEMDKEFPEYGFAKNKGYGTKEHMDKLREIGPCIYHRKSFLSFLNKAE